MVDIWSVVDGRLVVIARIRLVDMRHEPLPAWMVEALRVPPLTDDLERN